MDESIHKYRSDRRKRVHCRALFGSGDSWDVRMNLYRALYHGMIAVGRPIGGIRPRRLYDMLGRRAYPAATFAWTRDRWGAELLLSHHFHLDRNILIYGDYDHALHLLLERRVTKGMTALDVGANLGEMALHMARRVGAAGKVHAFEPMPGAFARLKGHVEKNGYVGRLFPWQIALGNSAGMLEMTLPAADADNQGLGSIVNPDIAAAAVRVAVEVTTLDAIRTHAGLGKIDFIKLDIQGAEWWFLEGAEQTIRECAPEIVMEISPGDLIKIGKTSRDLLAWLEARGYRIFEIHNGAPARPITAAAVPENYAATNVLCLPQKSK